MSERRRIIGTGNPDRGDDAAGLAVISRLRDHVPPGDAELSTAAGDVTALLAAWAGANDVAIVDTMRSGAPPGTIRRFDASALPLPSADFVSTSTHGLGLAAAVELGRILGQLPARLLIFAIEGESFDTGAPLSPAVAAAVNALAAELAIGPLATEPAQARG